MAVTVKKAWSDRPFVWHKDKDGARVLMWSDTLHLQLVKDGKEFAAAFRFCGRDSEPGSTGFRCDGLSVPKPFRWFLKDWDEDDELYNLAGAVHDWLYASVGACGHFTRSECDDIFRGILRESGVSRFKASTADLMVGLFAGCRLHWGNDSYGVRGLVRMETLAC